MKIEFILIGVIVLVFLIDFIFKRRKKGLIIPKQKIVSSKKRKFVLIISLLSTIVSSLLIYSFNPLFIFDKDDGVDFIDHFKFKRYHIDDVEENRSSKQLSFDLKRTMEPFSGIIYSDHGNIGLVNNGKANGLFNFYNINGSLKEKSSFLRGEANGLSLLWHQNQQLFIKCNYINGKLNGAFNEWREDGELTQSGDYINNMKEGEWIEVYFLDKKSPLKTKFIGEYLNNKRVNSWVLKRKDIQITMSFENGRFSNLSYINDDLSKFWELRYYVNPYTFDRDYIGVEKAAIENNMPVNQFLNLNLEGLRIHGQKAWYDR